MAVAQTLKKSLKAIQLLYQILWSMVTPLKDILFPQILGSRGVSIPPSRNRVEAGFAATVQRTTVNREGEVKQCNRNKIIYLGL